MEDDDEDNKIIELSTEAPSQTQADVSGLITDIFGDDDDDDEVLVRPVRKQVDKDSDDEDSIKDSDDDNNKTNKEDNDDWMNDDSSDDDFSSKKKKGKLSKSNKKRDKPKKQKARTLDDIDLDGLEDSENEQKDKKTEKRKRDKDGKDKSKKKKKNSREERTKRNPSNKIDVSLKKKESSIDSGDEYDSGEEVKRTADDDNFVASDDDLADVTKEYDEEEQNFGDERPEGYIASKKGRKGNTLGGGSNYTKKETDPLSETLAKIKKVKQEEMNDSDKGKIVTDLLAKMDAAARKDDLLYEQKQPALMKLHMLSTVTSIVSVRALQHTLLEYDILAVLKDWIAPKDANTLPSLTVRSAVYDILNKLPIGTEHLKRSAPGKQPIGTTIVALRKHKMETQENKRKLKDLMEKWCRPVFSKSVDPRSAVQQQSNELREVSINRLEAKERVNIYIYLLIYLFILFNIIYLNLGIK